MICGRNKDENGFSLLELLVVMALFTLIITAASQSFMTMMSDFKQQSRVASSNIEGLVGLEVFRRDINSAGFGLYWQLDSRFGTSFAFPPVLYSEVDASESANGSLLNDTGLDAPRGLAILPGLELNGSDRLAIRSVNVVGNEGSEKWTYGRVETANFYYTWPTAKLNINDEDYVVLVKPFDKDRRYLLATDKGPITASAKNYAVKYKDLKAGIASVHNTAGGLTEFGADTTFTVFSLGTTAIPKMPFNRADYYVLRPADMPERCAQGTGILYKAVVNQQGKGYLPALPLLDCVADMQVAVRYFDPDTNQVSGTSEVSLDDEKKTRWIREVRVYILAHEGQVDRNYTHQDRIMRVGESLVKGDKYPFGHDLDLSTLTSNWAMYRWKLYTIIIRPLGLMTWLEYPES